MLDLSQCIVVCNFKENERTKLEKMAKSQSLGPILSRFTQICASNCFLVSFTSTIVRLVPRYYRMQFQRKRMIQTKENDTKHHSGPDLTRCVQIRASLFFLKIWLCQSVDIIVSYHHIQYQKKQLIQNKVPKKWSFITSLFYPLQQSWKLLHSASSYSIIHMLHFFHLYKQRLSIYQFR